MESKRLEAYVKSLCRKLHGSCAQLTAVYIQDTYGAPEILIFGARLPFDTRYTPRFCTFTMAGKVLDLGKDDSQPVYIEAPHLRKVDWKRDPGLRKLYFWAFILCIASATTGYDAYVSYVLQE